MKKGTPCKYIFKKIKNTFGRCPYSKLSDLVSGDKVFLTSNNGNEMTYYVYDKYEINDNDMSCTSQETNGKIELTLITCTSKKNKRLVVKCRTDRA